MPNVIQCLASQSLTEVFPTRLPNPEVLVYGFVKAGALNYLADGSGATIPVVRGWPSYPGKVPAIGVHIGNENEDDQRGTISAGFSHDVIAYDEHGTLFGAAAYFAQPLYATVIVELIEENRDERDRLHDELRQLLFPLKRQLTDTDVLISRVRVDAEKQELDEGELPLTIYASVFTVHVYYEMMEAVEITDGFGVIQTITGTLNVLPNVDPIPDPQYPDTSGVTLTVTP